jgi:formylglycine-generating enzyme required for sulfatase activity
VTGSNPSQYAPSVGGTAFHPVDQVSWYDAVGYCRRLSARPEEKRAGRVYRLPTEAEWEYACRGGSMAAFAFGDELTERLANFEYHVLHPTHVGSYPRNGFGLYDTHGNVREWCSDWYGRDTYSEFDQTDPVGPDDGHSRVMRGGSWDVKGSHFLRSAYRVHHTPTSPLAGIGFRVVLEGPPG